MSMGESGTTQGPSSAFSEDGDDADELLRALAHAPDHSPPPAPGTTWGESDRYVIERRLGRGGMGVVYLAEDTLLRRRVALKVLHDERAAVEDPSGFSRVLREARAAASVEHERVARVYDVGEHAGRAFVSMELVRGMTLRRWMTGRKLELGEIVSLGMQIAEGLAALHAAGVVHRDLKPENVMLSETLAVKVLDFGLARFDAAGDAGQSGSSASNAASGGTPGYMAPEQLASTGCDARADVFALGVILYELVTARRPFGGRSMAELTVAMGLTPELDDHVWGATPTALRGLVQRALQRDPALRHADGAELVRAFREILAFATPVSLLPSEVSVDISHADTVALAPRKVGGRFFWLTAIVASVVALALGARSSTRGPVALTKRTPVSSRSAEASEAYAASVLLLHDASVALASKGFARALALDPEMAAAHLRIASYGMIADDLSIREHLEKAREYAHKLSAEDAAALGAEEAFAADPSDVVGHAGRWGEIARRFPQDAEIALEHAVALDEAGKDGEATREFTRTLRLDPRFALALLSRAVGLARRSDVEGAVAGIDACLAVSPTAVTCLRRRAALLDQRGDCAGFARDAQRMVALAPDDPQSSLLLSRALAASGGEPEGIRVARYRAALLFGAPWIQTMEQDGDLLIALWTGDLDRAEALARSLGAAAVDHINEFDHELPTSTLLALLDETGRAEDAARVARQYADLVPAWSGHEFISRAWVLRSLKHARGTRQPDYASTRAAWAQSLRNERAGRSRNFAWVAYFAFPATDAGDAEEALAVLPEYEPLPSSSPSWPRPIPFDEATGRVYLLAGRPAEAIPYLDRAAHVCSRMEDPVTWLRANLELARARQAIGDIRGACDAYRVPMTRWGALDGRAITVHAAVEEARALGCAP